MCGIVGLISKLSSGFWVSHANLFTNLLRIDTIRGEDSTGVFGVSKAGAVDILKGDADGYLFTSSKDYRSFYNRISKTFQFIVGHNRSATKGKIAPENAHPFAEGNIVLVHNGTIHNQDDLNKNVEVDSHAIAHALNDHKAVEALGKIDGAYALVWYHREDKTLNLARNAERPLWLVEYEDFWVFASELGLILWLNRRENKKELRILEVPHDKILSLPLGRFGTPPDEITYEAYAGSNWVDKWTSWRPTWVRQLNAPNRTPTLENDKVATDPILATGQVIKVTFDDDQVNPAGTGIVYLGKMIMNDGTIDENIIVRHHVLATEEIKEMEANILKHRFWTAIVSSCGTYQGVPIVHVHTPKPLVDFKKSKNGAWFDEHMLVHIFEKGCQRCNSALDVSQIGETLVKQRKDGTYRVICERCLAAAVQAAHEKNTVNHVH